jgi:hypothetical protein
MKRLLSMSLGVLALATPLAAQSAPMAAPSGYIPAPESKLPVKMVAKPTSADISAKDLMSRLYIFADDSMLGRETGTLGNVRGTDYIAAEAKRLGLVPAGENGTYFQTLPFKSRATDSTSTITTPTGSLTYGTEWAARVNSSFSKSDMAVVYGGTVGDTTTTLSDEQVNGKLVVFAFPTTPGARVSFRSVSRVGQNAGAVLIVGPDQLLNQLKRPATFVDDPDAGPGPRPLLFATRTGAAKLFDSPMEGLTPGTPGKAVSVDIKVVVTPLPFPARNVVGILPGRDARLKGEYVAIGAHNDHVGTNSRPVDHDSLRIFNHLVRPGGAEDGGKQATPDEQLKVNADLAAWRAAHPNTARLDSISNGADDDGSGSVSVLEIAEKLTSLKGNKAPRRSILFVWHTGEEKGLLGSAWFTDHPTVSRDSIVAQLNMDMVGRGNQWDVTGASSTGAPLRGNPNYVQIVGSRRLSTQLGDIIEQVNKDKKHKLEFVYAMYSNGHPMNNYCRSDHYEYARYGIPIAILTTGGHSDYHQVTDEPQYIDYPHMARVTSLVADVAMNLADRSDRITVDKPKPDPKGTCQQ